MCGTKSFACCLAIQSVKTMVNPKNSVLNLKKLNWSFRLKAQGNSLKNFFNCARNCIFNDFKYILATRWRYFGLLLFRVCKIFRFFNALLTFLKKTISFKKFYSSKPEKFKSLKTDQIILELEFVISRYENQIQGWKTDSKRS